MKASFIILITTIFLLIGCGSKVPIADLSKAVANDDIIGNWTSVKQDSSEYIGFTVRKFNGLEYAALVYEEKTDSAGITSENFLYRLYIIDIENTLFINAQDINSGNPQDRLFHFLKYEKDSDTTATLTTLKDIGDTKIDNFKESEKLYSFIRENVNNEKLYRDPVQLVRVKNIRSFKP